MMKYFFAFALIVFAVSLPAADQCLTCHKELGTPQAVSFEQDVHFKAGLSCASCHGGDSSADDMEIAMSSQKGFIGKIKAAEIPKVCGKCHGEKNSFGLKNVSDDFEKSVHGKALSERADGPQCISCHGVHNIVKVRDKSSPVHPLQIVKTCADCHSNVDYMKRFNPSLPVDQYEKYLTSVHGKRNSSGDTNAATCVSCHSNHLIYAVRDPRADVYPTKIPAMCSRCHSNSKIMATYGIPTNQYEQYAQSVHGIALIQKSDLNAPACNSCHGNHGAAPPGIDSAANVCGTCHQGNEELFQKSVHKEAFSALGLAGCVACHSNHLVKSPSDAMVGLSNDSNCGQCHSQSDTAANTIKQTRQALDQLTTGQEESRKLLARAEQMGMDVEEAKYELKDVNQALIETRVKIHAFDLEPILKSSEPGLQIITKTKKTAAEAIQEYHFRRKGLFVSTFLITLVAVLLYLKIKQIEKKQAG